MDGWMSGWIDEMADDKKRRLCPRLSEKDRLARAHERFVRLRT